MPFDSTPIVRHADEIAILDRMAELLATPERWCQGSFSKEAQSHCVLGALRTLCPYDIHLGLPTLVPRSDSAYRRVIRALSGIVRKIAGETSCIGDYNDAPSTTHADILTLIAHARRSFEEMR